jgi:syntaxin 1B/2/3
LIVNSCGLDFCICCNCRYFTITGEKPDEDTIEKIIETGESENFLQVAIHEQGRGQILETIREIQERHDTVKEIEKNLLELHQIFLDMAVLVEAQGEQLNDIESQVNNAANYVARGTGQLKTAKKHQRNTRKWVCIGIILLLLLILLVIVPVAKSIHDAAVAASGH